MDNFFITRYCFNSNQRSVFNETLLNMKLFITDFKKQTLYGDVHAFEEGVLWRPFRGQRIQVKILGLFWLTYKYYTIN